MSEVKAKFLSGGQKRKLVISMALLGNPSILLCDEIFAALDINYSNAKRNLKNLQKENLKCVLLYVNIKQENFYQ